MNPFETKTPEQNSAQEVVDLFVDVFADFYQVLENGHTFLNGPRGSGKSMMFRYMLPDCQRIVTHKYFNELEYFSLYIPIKLTNISLTELSRLENQSDTILNEHILVTHFLSTALKSIADIVGEELNSYTEDITKFFKSFKWYVELSGYNFPEREICRMTGVELVHFMAEIVDKMKLECLFYCKQIALAIDVAPYRGSLVDFIDFMLPILKELKKVSIFPKDKPFFILVDDAGYLNKAQTMILNSWVSYRTTKDICLKISTQLDYKTYLTSNGKKIDAPHDYSEINIATIYTSPNGRYFEKIQKIVEKRIKYYLDIEYVDVEDFFPEDKEQERRICEIADELRSKNFDPERSYAGGDAARRYARSEFIKELKKGLSAPTYSYAGFRQLVAISSGIIRHFLASAQMMYSEALALNTTSSKIKCIPAKIQNEMIRKYSERFLFDDFDKRLKGTEGVKSQNAVKLFKLIDNLGQLFHKLLISDCSERRVFSVALTDSPDEELAQIFRTWSSRGVFTNEYDWE